MANGVTFSTASPFSRDAGRESCRASATRRPGRQNRQRHRCEHECNRRNCGSLRKQRGRASGDQKAVCDPMPPNAPARSAAFPLCNSTTTIRKIHTITCTIAQYNSSNHNFTSIVDPLFRELNCAEEIGQFHRRRLRRVRPVDRIPLDALRDTACVSSPPPRLPDSSPPSPPAVS